MFNSFMSKCYSFECWCAYSLFLLYAKFVSCSS